MCKAVNYSEELMRICSVIQKESDEMYDKIHKLEELKQDLEHVLENSKFNVVQGYKIAKMIKDARVRRRQLKMELETLSMLKKEFVDKSINGLKTTHRNVVKRNADLQSLKEHKVYSPRVLKSMDVKKVVLEDIS